MEKLTRRFTDEMDIRFLRPDDPRVQTIPNYQAGRVYGVLLGPLTWEVEYTGTTPPLGLHTHDPSWVTIPTGFISDGVTNSRLLWWFLPSWGHPIVRAAILHDWLIHLFRSTPHPAFRTRRTIDAVFYTAARALGVTRFVAGVAWTVVRAVSLLKGEG